MSRWLYTAVGVCLLPWLVVYLQWRGIRQPAYRRHWGERFRGGGKGRSAFSGQERAGMPILWIHAVSVGETRAAAPLITQWLGDAGQAARVVLTHSTPTGRETGAHLLDDLIQAGRLVQAYLPYDLPWANARFLRWAQPTAGLLMETELWPNLLSSAQRRGLPMALINARLSERSAKRFNQFSALSRPALSCLGLVVAQSAADADRLQAAGYTGEMVIAGNLKFDVLPDAAQVERGRAWRALWPRPKAWLVVSSRDDEEAAIGQAWVEANPRGTPADTPADTLLVVVPRHPQRFERVVQILEKAGLRVMRRSAGLSLGAEVDCLVGDSLGEVASYVAATDLALVGGSLMALGGQNPIEVCAQGRPVFFGPHMFNFQAISRDLSRAGAGFEVRSASEWIAQARELVAKGPAYRDAATAAGSFASQHRGAVDRTYLALMSWLMDSRSAGPRPPTAARS